ncbi:hypothetical protein [Lampropedia hyalina]|uniref:hypothetical protein n=1 Tax=Lampropedia hyalina TaxID=198706 RepID=UPI00116151F4|nr:hypothetical protein [Lampropedia hyalina]
MNDLILLRLPPKETPIFEHRIALRHVMPDSIRHPVTTLAKTPCLPMACVATGCRIESGMTVLGALRKAAMVTWQVPAKTFQTAVGLDPQSSDKANQEKRTCFFSMSSLDCGIRPNP